jgi:hypothetical protein
MTPPAAKSALYIKKQLQRVDSRLLVPLCISFGISAWSLPGQFLLFFVPLALLFYLAAFVLLPGGRIMLAAYVGFSVFWAASFFLLQLWEHPDKLEYSLQAGLVFGFRLFTLLGLALPVSLALTAIKLGRVLTWYVQRLAWLEKQICSCPGFKGKWRPRIAENAWRCGLALAIMAAFLSRAFRLIGSLRRTLRVRSAHLPVLRRLTLLALAVLRVFSVQTLDMTTAIVSRDLYRPLPWEWRA